MNTELKQKKDLEKAVQFKDPWDRSIRVAAVLAEALRHIGQNPILVGGAAVEFYTKGGYSTSDIDMIAPGGPQLVAVMTRLGFEKFGKDYHHSSLNLYVEFPAEALQDNETFNEIEIEGRILRIISIEDIIIDRLCAFKFWRSEIDGVNAMLLIELGEHDPIRVLSRAQEAKVLDAFEGVESLKEEIIRKKIPKTEANQLIKKLMLSLKKY